MVPTYSTSTVRSDVDGVGAISWAKVDVVPSSRIADRAVATFLILFKAISPIGTGCAFELRIRGNSVCEGFRFAGAAAGFVDRGNTG